MNCPIDILWQDRHIAVLIKPAGVLSEEAPDGQPALLRAASGEPQAEIYPVHRLDRLASGVMVYAKTKQAAAVLSQEITDGRFEKEYLAAVCGTPEEKQGSFTDLLYMDRAKNKTFVVKKERKGVKEAKLMYELLETSGDLSLVRVRLLTGRTHQIRVQFASRKMPLYGDGKYGARSEKDGFGLFSYRLRFLHPVTGEEMIFERIPKGQPWERFGVLKG